MQDTVWTNTFRKFSLVLVGYINSIRFFIGLLITPYSKNMSHIWTLVSITLRRKPMTIRSLSQTFPRFLPEVLSYTIMTRVCKNHISTLLPRRATCQPLLKTVIEWLDQSPNQTSFVSQYWKAKPIQEFRKSTSSSLLSFLQSIYHSMFNSHSTVTVYLVLWVIFI